MINQQTPPMPPENQVPLPPKAGSKISLILIILVFLIVVMVPFIKFKVWRFVVLKTIKDNIVTQQAPGVLFSRFANSSNRGRMVVDKDSIWTVDGAGMVKSNKITGEQEVFTESNGLISNKTQNILQYRDEIWISSNLRGVSILNTKDNSWRYLTTDNDLISENVFYNMKLDGDIVWISVFGGVQKYDFKTKQWISWQKGDGIKFGVIHNLIFNENFVWISTDEQILRLDKKNLRWQDMKLGNKIFPEGRRSIVRFYLDGDFLYVVSNWKIYRQNIFLGEEQLFDNNEENLRKFHIGETKYDGKYFSFNHNDDIEIFNPIDNSLEIVNTGFLRQYCPTRVETGIVKGFEKYFNFEDNILWIGCEQGFVQYNLGTTRWSWVSTKINYPARIYNILTANNGKLLVYSNLGLGLVVPDKHEWTFIKFLEPILDNGWAGAVWIEDDIYFAEFFAAGMRSWGERRLWKYNTLSKNLEQVKIPGGRFSFNLLDLKINGHLWARQADGIIEFDPISGGITLYKLELAENQFLEIGSLDKKENILWFASNLGLGRLDLTSKELEIIGSPSAIGGFAPGLSYLKILENEVWTSVFGLFPENAFTKGIHIYDLDSKSWKQLTSANSGLKFDRIMGIKGNQNYILIPSYGRADPFQRQRGDKTVISSSGPNISYNYDRHGLNIFDIKKKIWKFYTSDDGMLDGSIDDFYIDGEDVWFINSRIGLWRMSLKDPESL